MEEEEEEEGVGNTHCYKSLFSTGHVAQLMNRVTLGAFSRNTPPPCFDSGMCHLLTVTPTSLKQR